MSKIVKMSMDDNGNKVPENEATRINIAEYDEDGRRIMEIYGTTKIQSPEEAKAYWDNVKVDSNNAPFKESDFFTDEDFEKFVEEHRKR